MLTQAGTATEPAADQLLYRLEDNPGPVQGVLYGVQHLLLMLAPTSLAPVILSGIVHLPAHDTVILVSATMVAAGIATMLQGQGLGRVGARLPIVQGAELFFIPPLGAIALQAGMGALATLVAAGGLMVAILGQFFFKVRRFFPPLVVGTVITLIGVYLIPVGAGLMLGQGGRFYGTADAFILGVLTVILIVAMSFYLKGFAGSVSILLGIVVAYLVAIPMRMVDFAPVVSAAWIGLPRVLPFGLALPTGVDVAVILVLFVVAGIEALGYVAATCELVGVAPTSDRIARGLFANGLGSFVSGILGSTPMTAYAQNLSALGVTRVGTRYVSLYAGALMILMGLVPKFDALVTTIPAPVLGGGLLVLFGTVAGVGVRTLAGALRGQRELLIFATSLALGVGFALAPSAGLRFMPPSFRIALQTGVAIGALTVIVLNAAAGGARGRPQTDAAG